MHYYEFTPRSDNNQANLKLVADTESELAYELLSLQGQAVGHHRDNYILVSEIDQLIETAADSLPIATMSRLAYLGAIEDIINTNNGLAVAPSRNQNNFEDSVFELDNASTNEESNNEILDLIHSGLCNANAWTVEIQKSSGKATKLVDHKTYGRIEEDGSFTPIVTALSKEHLAVRMQANLHRLSK